MEPGRPAPHHTCQSNGVRDDLAEWPKAVILQSQPWRQLCMFKMHFGVQSFWQRGRNYLQNVLVRNALLPTIRASQKQFVQSTGHSFKTYETGVSSSAAAIAVGDWSLEFPVPLPPKVHVSMPCTNTDPSRSLSSTTGVVL